MTELKIHTSFDEQIKKLEYRGLIIDFDNRKVFIHIVIIKYLVADQKNWNNFFISLQQLVNQYQNYIDLKLIGFPNNWVEVLSKI